MDIIDYTMGGYYYIDFATNRYTSNWIGRVLAGGA
jgi:hypothetical protein